MKLCVIENVRGTKQYRKRVIENAIEIKRYVIRVVKNSTEMKPKDIFHRKIVSEMSLHFSFKSRHLGEIRISNTSRKNTHLETI